MGAQTLSSRAIIGMFYEELRQVTGAGWVDPLSMLFTSDQDSEVYKWLGMVPAMREWIGGRQAKGFRENGIEITNLHFEATIEFLVKELRRDKTGQIRVRIGELAQREQSHWASLLSTLIEAGESTACYDGQFFFDTDHAEGSSGSLSNDLAAGDDAVFNVGTAAAPTPYELSLVFLRMVQQFYTFKDDQGEPINENAMSFLAMVPVNMLGAAVQVMTKSTVSTGSGTVDNPVKDSGFSIKVACNPRLTWTTKLAMFRTDGKLKPFIRQQEEGTEVKLKAIAEGSELEFLHDKHQYGIDTWRNVGYGMWQYACLGTLS